MNKKIMISIGEKLHERCKLHSMENEISVSGIVRMALMAYLDKEIVPFKAVKADKKADPGAPKICGTPGCAPFWNADACPKCGTIGRSVG